MKKSSEAKLQHSVITHTNRNILFFTAKMTTPISESDPVFIRNDFLCESTVWGLKCNAAAICLVECSLHISTITSVSLIVIEMALGFIAESSAAGVQLWSLFW
jgi:hypothetical protein